MKMAEIYELEQVSEALGTLNKAIDSAAKEGMEIQVSVEPSGKSYYQEKTRTRVWSQEIKLSYVIRRGV